MDTNESLVIRLRFPVMAGEGCIPLDHSSALYGVISRTTPELHTAGISISLIEGCSVFDNVLQLERKSHFFLQVPYKFIPHALKLAGQQLNMNSRLLRIGVPELRLIQASPNLFARLVTVKGKTEEQSLREHIDRTIAQFALSENDLQYQLQILRRRVLGIHGKKIIAFGVKLTGLTDDISVSIQKNGIGGRARYGCGFFMPYSEITKGQGTNAAITG